MQTNALNVIMTVLNSMYRYVSIKRSSCHTLGRLRMRTLALLGIVLFSNSAVAMNGKTTYQAKIIKPDGSALEAVSVNFQFTILNPAGTCTLYAETYAAINMTGTGGLVSFGLGNGTPTTSSTGIVFSSVFDNSTASYNCLQGGTYSPAATHDRKIVMQFQDASGWQTLPAMSLNAVPYAMYAAKAQDSLKLNNKSDTAFVEYSTLATLGCNSATHAITFNGVGFVCIAVGSGGGGVTSVTTSGSVLSTGGTASAPIISITAATLSADGYLTSVDYAEFKAKLGASQTQIVNTLGYAPVSGAAVATQIASSNLSGDVSGAISANSVVSVGGKSAAQISTSVDATLAASSGAVLNALVKRDGSGNSSFNSISADAASLYYANIYRPSTNFSIKLQAPTSLAANYTLNLPTSSGTLGQVLSTDGAGNLSWVNSSTGSVTSVSGTADEITSSGGSTPVLGLADTGTAGTYYKVITDNKGRVTSGVTTLTLSDLPNTVLNTTSNFAGDISGMISNITVNRIQGVSVTVSSLTTNDILQYDGAKYINKNIPTCSGSQYLTFNGTNFTCVADSGASGTITTVSVTGPISSTGGTNPTLSIAQANSSTDGYLSSADFTIFANKITSSAASIAQVLGYVPAVSGSAGVGTLLVANNLSDLASATVARNNLGLAALAQLNFVDLSGAQASGTLAAARLPAFAGDVTTNIASITTTVAKLRGVALSATAPTSGQVLTYNGTQWAPATTSAASPYSLDAADGAPTQALYMTNEGNVSIAADKVYAWGGASSDLTGKGFMFVDGTNGLTIGSCNNADCSSRSPFLANSGASLISNTTSFRIYTGATAAAPAFSFANDSDTGAFAPAADVFAFATGGAERMRVNSAGNVGIGINSPTAKLHLASGTTSTASLKFTSGTLLSSPQSGTMEYDGFNFYLTDASNIRRSIATGSNSSTIDEVSFINSTGNIAMTPVGSVVVSSTTASTNSQTGSLVVKGGMGIAGNIYSSGTIITSSNIQGVSVTATSGMVSPYIAGSVVSGGSLTLDSTNHASKGNIFLAPNGGNVGIGTTNPGSAFEVSSSSRVVTKIVGSNAVDTVLDITNTATNGRGWQLRANGTSALGDGNFVIYDAVSATARMAISSLGNVGIGTNTPEAPFNVIGSIQTGMQSGLFSTLSANSLAFQRSAVSGAYSYIDQKGIGGAIMFRTSQASSQDTQVMTLTASGNVGVGTNTPNARLQVSGAVVISSDGTIGATGALRVKRLAADADNIISEFYYADAGATNPRMQVLGSANKISLKTTFSAGGADLELGTNTASSALIIKESGNVGIGTTAPATDLHVLNSTGTFVSTFEQDYNGGSGAYLALKHSRNGGGLATNDYVGAMYFQGMNSGSFYSDIANVFVQMTNVTSGSESGNIQFWTRNAGARTEKVRIDSSGNVGIGTIAPLSVLMVEGGGSLGDRQLIVKDNASLASNVGGGISLGGNSTAGGSFTAFGEIKAGKLNATSGNLNGYLSFSANNGTVVSEAMRITSSGYVGVNTTNPQAIFNVNGDMAVGLLGPGFLVTNGNANRNALGITGNGNSSAESTGGLYLGNNRATPAVNDNAGIISFGSANNAGSNRSVAEVKSILAGAGGANGFGGALVFYTKPDNVAAVAEVMRIAASGSVGIGTTSPGYKLDVSGTINIASGSALAFGGTSVCTAAGCTSSSDERLKENIKPLDFDLNKLL